MTMTPGTGLDSKASITVKVKCAHCGLDFTDIIISTNTVACVLQPCPNCMVEAYAMGGNAKVLELVTLEEERKANEEARIQSSAVSGSLQQENTGAEQVLSPAPEPVA